MEVYYCDEKCQNRDWAVHKFCCKKPPYESEDWTPTVHELKVMEHIPVASGAFVRFYSDLDHISNRSINRLSKRLSGYANKKLRLVEVNDLMQLLDVGT